MAWLDPSIYAHPKLLRCSEGARWVYVAGLAYSDGFSTRGVLTPAAQRIIGAHWKHRDMLVLNGLWNVHDAAHKTGIAPTNKRDGMTVVINGWEEHNGRRDDAREARLQADRDRKRAERAAQKSARTSNGQSTGQSAGRPHTHNARLLSTEREELNSLQTAPNKTRNDVTLAKDVERTHVEDDLTITTLDPYALLATKFTYDPPEEPT